MISLHFDFYNVRFVIAEHNNTYKQIGLRTSKNITIDLRTKTNTEAYSRSPTIVHIHTHTHAYTRTQIHTQ